MAIHLTRHHHLGALLRGLRRNSGLTLRQLAAITHVSPSGVHKREASDGITAAGLIDHAHALGYAVALVPQRHPGARETGTGWPA